MKEDRVSFNEETKCYYIKCNADKIRVSTIGGKKDIDKKLLEEISIWLEKNIEQIKEFGAQELVDLKNEDWLEDNQEEITEIEFIKKLNLQNIVIHKKGNLDMIFDADDIFYDHCVTIYTDENFIIKDALLGY